MRVTGGAARGRRLASPRRPGVRPTGSRVREALFDILGARIRGAAVLDLFAGTGAIGVEALSRGADGAVFVERDRRAARLIETNLSRAGLTGAGRVLAMPADRAIERLEAAGDRFDLVFADPPYEAGVREALLRRAAGLMKEGALLVVEHATRAPVAAPADGPLRTGRRYRYGDTTLTLLHLDASART